MSTNSGDLRPAIEQLRPKLPQILGPNYSAFEEELETLLLSGTENQLLDLFGRYPDAHEHLLDILAPQRKEEETKGIRLGGDPLTPKSTSCYRCNSKEPHTVAPENVVYNIAGDPVCPQHHTVMTIERPCQEGG